MNSRAELGIVGTTSALACNLPERKAAALVLLDDSGLVLLVRRNRDMVEFPGVWSFPSVYERPGCGLCDLLRSMLNAELAVKVEDMMLIASRMGVRPQRRISMHLYLARATSVPRLTGGKYDAWDWVDGPSYAAGLDPEKTGDCLKAYRDWLRKV